MFLDMKTFKIREWFFLDKSPFYFSGHYVMVNELLPLLKTTAPSRVVLITSAAYSLGNIHYDDINLEKVK